MAGSEGHSSYIGASRSYQSARSRASAFHHLDHAGVTRRPCCRELHCSATAQGLVTLAPVSDLKRRLSYNPLVRAYARRCAVPSTSPSPPAAPIAACLPSAHPPDTALQGQREESRDQPRRNFRDPGNFRSRRNFRLLFPRYGRFRMRRGRKLRKFHRLHRTPGSAAWPRPYHAPVNRPGRRSFTARTPSA
jgi:hypothetical protein